MGAEEMAWRKLPRNIITDPVMDYIASKLPPEYQSAPYMFYMVAMSVADDDGIFDLEDGVIFSRLMHMGDPNLVAKIANYMLERKIIVRFGTTSTCMITQWGYSSKAPARTIQQRREIVQRKIEAERQKASQQFRLLETANSNAPETEAVIPLDFSKNPCSNFTADFNSVPAAEQQSFTESKSFENPAENNSVSVSNAPGAEKFCPDDDKNKKNVVKKIETEKIREDKNRLELEKNTHTQEEETREIERPQFQAPTDEPYIAAEEELKQETTETQQETSEVVQETAPLTDTGPNTSGLNVDEQEKTRLYELLTDFFTKNCLGFSAAFFKNDINIIMSRIFDLADETNPPNIIAANLLGQFKKLTESGGYYYGQPLTPTSLLKPGMWEHTLAAVSKILLTSKPKKKSETTTPPPEEEIIDRQQVCDEMDAEYIKFNIDPQDPERFLKLIEAKKKAESGGSSP